MRRTHILCVLVALLVAACGAEQGTLSETTEAPPLTQAVVPSTTTTAGEVVEVDWNSLEVMGPDMATPGQFRTTDGFVAPFHMMIPETMKYLGSESYFLLLIPSEEEFIQPGPGEHGLTRGLLVIDMGLGSVEDTVSWFESQPTMTVGEQSNIAVGGYDAVTFDVTTPEVVTVPNSGQFFEPDWIYRPAILDLDGTTVTVLVEAHLDAFDGFWADLRPVLRTLTWAPEHYVEYVEPERPTLMATPGSVEDGLTLTVELEIPDPAPGQPSGIFEAVGSAVDAGWFCDQGTYTQLSYAEVDPANAIETWEMDLACGDDGSITVTVESEGQETPGGWYSDNEWTITATSGGLSGATGMGGGFSECIDLTCLDVYEGRLLVESASYFEVRVETPDVEDVVEAVYVATGVAVESGIVCAEGDMAWSLYNEDDWPTAVKSVGLRCDAPAGEFTIDIVAEGTDADGYSVSGTWTLLNPAGAFSSYGGGGDSLTVCDGDICTDQFSGWISN